MPSSRFDPRALADISGGDVAFERELLEEYLATTDTLIAAQRSAIDAGDVRTLERSAHSMKGSSRTIGAELLGQLGQDIEASARSGDLARALAGLDRAVQEFAALRGDIEGHLRRLAA